MDAKDVPDLDFDLNTVWDQFLLMVQTTGVEFVKNLAGALIIFYVGRWVAGMVVRGIATVMQKSNMDKTLETFICNLVRMTLILFVVIAAVNQLGIQTTSLIAVLGAAGLAVGLALQGSLSNFASGVLIILFRPYKVGDYIEGAGVAGSVEDMQILTTVLTTSDNKRVIVPNSQIMGSIITNYSSNDQRRIDLVVGVSYDDDIDKVRDELKALIAADDRILDDPACLIAVSELADSSVNFVLRPWVKTSDYSAVKFGLTEAIKKRFDEVGISLPFPQHDIHLHNVSAD